MRPTPALAALLAVAAAAPAAGHDHPPRAGRPADSGAPEGAAPHWIPNEEWVQQHWLPFDEAALHALLRTNRRQLWRYLRDDTHTLGALGVERGFAGPQELARKLVAPRRVSAEQRRTLEARALRVLTQGHLSQHMVFHTLHQNAGPRQARTAFGVAGTAEFQRLRRLDLSPLRIGRLHGRTRGGMQGGIERALRAAAASGVRGGDVSARQSALFVQRQLRQVPRWLGEDHYNGPPVTRRGKPVDPFRPSWATPALSTDGTHVVFDAAQPLPPLAVRFGEVNLEGRRLADGAAIDPRDASRQALATRPCSSFNPSLSADGRRVAYELSAGNTTFAKRYGNVRVAVGDLGTRSAWTVPGIPGTVSTAYAPALSGDGRRVAFVEAAAHPMSASRSWASRVVVAAADRGGGSRVAVTAGDSAEPALSHDGTRVAFTQLRGGRSQVYVRDLASGRTLLVSRLAGGAPAGGEAWAPSLSADGTRVAFATRASAGDEPAVHVRDLATGITVRVGPGDEPALSADGRTIALSLPAPGTSASGRPRQQVRVVPVAGGPGRVASVVASGAVADGWSGQPSLSGDGTRVAFTTDAPALGAGGPGPGNLHVIVRDLVAGTTTTANAAVPASRFDTGAGALSTGGRTLCALEPPSW